jgi:hypothetical protein
VEKKKVYRLVWFNRGGGEGRGWEDITSHPIPSKTPEPNRLLVFLFNVLKRKNTCKKIGIFFVD